MKNIFRALQIQHVILKYGLERGAVNLPRFYFLKLLLLTMPWMLFAKTRHRGSLGERSKLALIELGPIFIKFGQTLSTRRDILSDDFAHHLSQLQDNVPPFAAAVVRHKIEAAYGKKLPQVFKSFQPQALASASIAQVHQAVLPTGEQVVVKILRPKVKRRIKTDVAMMYAIAKLVERSYSDAQRLRLSEVVAEYEKTIFDELDLIREAANGSLLRRNFDNSPSLYVPKIYWDYCRENILVAEYIEGINIGDMQSLKEHNIDLKKLAERGVEIFFTQVFKHNFFHADMHPGNIFVAKDKANDPQYMCVDYGIVGSLNAADQRYIGENLLAFFRRDYHKVAVLHVESGWMTKPVRVDEFEAAVRSACEPIFEKPLAEISFGVLLLRLFKISRRYGYQVQPQLVLLQKTLLNIEGLGRQLYPQLDLWATAKPFLEEWVRQQYDLRHAFKDVGKYSPELIEQLQAAPKLLTLALKQLASDNRAQQLKMQAKINATLQRGQRQQLLLAAVAAVALFWYLY